MKIAISGGTGLVGMALANELLLSGHEVIILTRTTAAPRTSSKLQYVQWLSGNSQPEKELEGLDAIVNLAGATINSRWTNEYKERILQSRLQATAEINRIMSVMKKKPEVLVNASAVGYYGTSRTAVFTEGSPSGKDDFLAETVERWESSALQAENTGVRVVICRFGVILDEHGGALPRMVLPYKFFAGGKIGSGKQWLSWIHIVDTVRALTFAIENQHLRGPVNVTAPSPVTMDEFGENVSSVLRKPHWLPVPSFVLKALLGEMSVLVLEGQRVLPEKLLNAGFSFNFPDLAGALKNIFNQ